jgi:DNA-binding response OmpR family regulator
MRTRDGLHALIIEDELLQGMGLQLMLSRMGYGSFSFASTETQALEQARLQRPDLVTVDLSLLDGDGLEAARHIVEALGPVPVMFVTGDPSGVAGLDGATVVEKPVTPGMLSAAVERLKRGDPGPFAFKS